jgi:hypothetical protein
LQEVAGQGKVRFTEITHMSEVANVTDWWGCGLMWTKKRHISMQEEQKKNTINCKQRRNNKEIDVNECG